MRGSNGIDIMLFHQPQILDHMIDRNRLSKLRVGVMTIDTLKLYRLTVDREHAILNGYFA